MRALRSALALLLAAGLAGCAGGGYQNGYGYPSYGSSYGGYPAYAEPGYGVAYGPSVSFGTAYPSYYYGGYPYWQQPYWHNWNNNHWNNGHWNNGNWNNGHWNNGNGNWSNGHWNPPPNQGNGQGRPPGNKPPQHQWVNNGGTNQNPLARPLNGRSTGGGNFGRGTTCRECPD